MNSLRVRQFLGWCVHLYTALGLLAAGGIAVGIIRGDTESMLWAFVLMIVATVIDATDGTMARAIRIKEILPGFDGRRLDDLVDFLTYTALPLLLIWRCGVLPPGLRECVLVPLLASAYGFCQVHAKTADGYFLGFPSYWNVIAFYLYVAHTCVAPLPAWVPLTVLLGFSFLTFVPSRYLYPSQRGWLNQLTNVLAAVWVGLLIWILRDLLARDGDVPGDPLTTTLILVSLLFPAYYLLVSWAISVKMWWTPLD